MRSRPLEHLFFAWTERVRIAAMNSLAMSEALLRSSCADISKAGAR